MKSRQKFAGIPWSYFMVPIGGVSALGLGIYGIYRYLRRSQRPPEKLPSALPYESKPYQSWSPQGGDFTVDFGDHGDFTNNQRYQVADANGRYIGEAIATSPSTLSIGGDTITGIVLEGKPTGTLNIAAA